MSNEAVALDRGSWRWHLPSRGTREPGVKSFLFCSSPAAQLITSTLVPGTGSMAGYPLPRTAGSTEQDGKLACSEDPHGSYPDVIKAARRIPVSRTARPAPVIVGSRKAAGRRAIPARSPPASRPHPVAGAGAGTAAARPPPCPDPCPPRPSAAHTLPR